MTTLECASTVHSTILLDRREPAPGIVVLGLHAPGLVRVTRPGQFVMVIPPTGESAATALAVYEAQGDRASIFFVLCGSRTRELAGLHIGARLDLFGPLGNGFDLSFKTHDVALVAGGVGIASLWLAAEAIMAAGGRVRLYYGARTKGLLADSRRFSDAGCSVQCATDDGSYGYHGYVTQLLDSCTDVPQAILGCGPSPMLRALAKVAAKFRVVAQLSLEETFACGVGACWGCVVPLDRNSAQAPNSQPDDSASGHVYARICKEGPVFRSDELRW
ncbi:MAG: dihydroorotate dehydrogenase electron transfer subunit [Candidatus Eremiobacteraeota bacterium]|nr:dihydroorotate dehydrogenase electron transfer subunit [Candidatus Eremiobacteraeota bacterium]